MEPSLLSITYCHSASKTLVTGNARRSPWSFHGCGELPVWALNSYRIRIQCTSSCQCEHPWFLVVDAVYTQINFLKCFSIDYHDCGDSLARPLHNGTTTVALVQWYQCLILDTTLLTPLYVRADQLLLVHEVCRFAATKYKYRHYRYSEASGNPATSISVILCWRIRVQDN